MLQLLKRFEEMSSPRIALVGDYMLDRTIYGDTERISKEAPVPILRDVRRESLVGGAGNVATAIVALGAKVVCIGVIGDDDIGDEIVDLLSIAGADTSGLVRIAGRQSTIKTRYVGLAQHRRAQQMFRVDSENTDPLDASAIKLLTDQVEKHVANCHVLALQDYGKGVLNHRDVPSWIASARKLSKHVIVDPHEMADYSKYRGATLLTPNRYEAALASGASEEVSLPDMITAGEAIIEVTGADAVAVTVDRDGIVLVRAVADSQCKSKSKSESKNFPTRPQAVFDVSGAGDIVLAVFASVLGSGLDLDDACNLANIGGWLEVERFGVWPISRQEIVTELRSIIGLRRSKVLSREDLAGELVRRRKQGGAMVFTNGCFDLLHMGHVKYLQQARELGTALIVAINSDDSVRRLKGQARPIIGQDERAEMLGALECVDFVTVFDDDTPESLLEQLKPDILAKGGTTPIVVGREIVEGYGGKVLTLDAVAGRSTTEIIDRIVESRS